MFLSARTFAGLHLNWSNSIPSTNHGSAGCPECGLTQASAVATGDEGEIYAALATYDSSGTNGWDTILRKYSATGLVEWDHLFRSASGENDSISSVTVASANRVFVVGAEYNRTFFGAVSAGGEAIWLTNQSDFAAQAIAPIGDDAIVAGAARNPTNQWAGGPAVIRRFDIGGGLVWSQGFGDVAEAKAVVVSPTGNIYVAGIIDGKQLLLRLSPSGELIWSRVHSDITSQDSFTPPNLVLDASEHVFIGSVGQISAFDSSGTLLWVESSLGTGRRKLLLDSNQDILGSVDSGSGVRFFKLSKTGVVGWESVFTTEYSSTTAITTDGTNLFAALSARVFSLPGVYTIMRLNSAGIRTWLWEDQDSRPAQQSFPFLDWRGGEIRITANIKSPRSSAGVWVTSFTETNSLPGPTLTSWPDSRVVTSGSTFKLEVAAESSGKLSYRWLQNGSPVYQATNSELVLSNVTSYQAGYYAVEATDANGSMRSPTFHLGVFVPPEAQETLPGASATLGATLTGTYAEHVQWWFNGNPIAGATNLALFIADTQLDDAGVYTLRWDDRFGGSHSFHVWLHVNDRAREEWRRVIGWQWDYFNDMGLDPATNLIVSSRRATDGIHRPSARVIASDGTFSEHIIPGVNLVFSFALDESGNIYLSGGAQYSSTVQTLKYSPGFNSLLWRQTNAYDTYRAYAGQPTRASAGRAFVSVHGQQRSATGYQFFGLLAVTETNSAHLAGGGGVNSDESILSIDLGRNNDLYLLTRRSQPWPGVLTVARLRQSGDPLWQLNGIQTNGQFTAAATDRDGNLILAGRIWETSITSTMKLDTNGNVLWKRTFAGGPSPRAVKCDSADNVVITGDGATLKYDTEGRLLWVTRTGGSFLGLDAVDNIYIAGGGGYPALPGVTACLTAAGIRLWQVPFRGVYSSHRTPMALSVAASGDAYVAFGVGPQYPEGFTIVKYSAAGGTQSPPPPIIPATAIAQPGHSFTLNVNSPGPNAVVQWFHDGVLLDGQTNATLSLPFSTTNTSRGYSVEIRNAFGSILTPETWVTEPLVLARGAGPSWHFVANPHWHYEVQRSSDLDQWTALETYSGVDGLVSFATGPGIESSEFYRVKVTR